jgi:hypothetical protein
MRPAAEVEALTPIFDALRRGTKRGRLRALDIVCSNGHRYAEVFPTAAGPVVVGWGRLTDGPDGMGGMLLDELTTDVEESRRTGKPLSVRLQCRCTTASIWAWWIRARLADGVRRAAYTESAMLTPR